MQTKALFSSYGYFYLQWRLVLQNPVYVSSVRTKFLFNLWVSLAPKGLLLILLATCTRVKKSKVYSHQCQKATICELQPLAQYCAHYCAHANTNPIYSFVSYIDPGNQGKPQCLHHIHNSFLWNNNYARLYYPRCVGGHVVCCSVCLSICLAATALRLQHGYSLHTTSYVSDFDVKALLLNRS